MIYLMGGNVSQPRLDFVREGIATVGVLHSPGMTQPVGVSYACDNGVYGAYQKGRTWDDGMHAAYLTMIGKCPADNPPMWVLLPDVVADWQATVELGAHYLPLLRLRGFRTAVALQNGCDFEEARQMDTDAVFVGGTTEWKEGIVHAVREAFPDKILHVGRVNTMRRLRICQSAGVDSVDGTALNKFPRVNLPRIARALNQPCLQL